ncbi:hypothetical protein [Parvularcula sp. LCG005]|uniref:hypothetical protein n=1 Tax=Parvularcula sp. LCG005 TaxID=3078805 RepID=UPI0029427377|nr:hypothetical protein [Parvularcula sp. LCG005]WOI52986.1 hypothetical protein RUI03_12590 [Parvularcula sp. LCG005]
MSQEDVYGTVVRARRSASPTMTQHHQLADHRSGGTPKIIQVMDAVMKRVSTYGGTLALIYLFVGEFVLPEPLKASTVVAEKVGMTTVKRELVAAPGLADVRRIQAEGERDAIITQAHGKSDAAAIEAEGQAQARLTIAPAETEFIRQTETQRARIAAAQACEVQRTQIVQDVQASCMAQTGRWSECSVRAKMAASAPCEEFADIQNSGG